MTLKLDSMITGTAGFTNRQVAGRVYHIARSGAVAIIDEDGRQWMVYEPAIVADPRPVISRGNIPARLR